MAGGAEPDGGLRGLALELERSGGQYRMMRRSAGRGVLDVGASNGGAPDGGETRRAGGEGYSWREAL
jgi:hypothetical protein